MSTSYEKSVEAAAAILREIGVQGRESAQYTPLTGGTYNTVLRITLDRGRDWVLKLPPRSTAGLAYERGLITGEITFYESAATVEDAGIVPRVVHSDDGAATDTYLIMTACPGTPWHEVADSLEEGEQGRLRAELGQLVARLHAVTGPGFGYPAQPLGPLTPTWREAFTTMISAVLDDAERYAARLPRSTAAIREVFAAASDVLDDVTRPALVHFDLWQGNQLLSGPPGAVRLSGLIDGERMFWGDPVADFVSLALFADVEEDKEFLTGYARAGGEVVFDDSVRRRLALYRAYLYLIMLVEVEPRKAAATDREWAWSHVAPQLVSALADVESG
ncbi:aminoglycoside phosphotransferase family protein [Streptomyces sp. NBC_01433]|uniref:phosphotransferase family protein n=1 Tax=Streptomyces sp. NBC_01433 TaxID=2903864 RepID=UPI0022569BBE|nr:aminoglycoside phosphotransferase family protein [Streptomyces sp. NBC_01433]MCX4681150.1 aminoglycoside phosphotransferase family protein [Streptomyces sp. NBC_01433]